MLTLFMFTISLFVYTFHTRLLLENDCINLPQRLVCYDNDSTSTFNSPPYQDNLKVISSNDEQMDVLFCAIQRFTNVIGAKLIIIVDDLSSRRIAVLPDHIANGEIIKYENSAQIKEIFLTLKLPKSQIIFLFCQLHCSVNLLHLSELVISYQKESYWIIMDRIVSQVEIKMPDNLISIDVRHDVKNRRLSDDNDWRICSTDENIDNSLTIYQYRQTSGWFQISNLQDVVGNQLASNIPRKSLKTVTIIEPPFTMISSLVKPDETFQTCEIGKLCYSFQTIGNETTKQWHCCYGLCIDLLILFERDLDEVTELYLVEDGVYGILVDGVFNGMIGDLVQDKADILVAALTISKNRSLVVDFAEPFMTGSLDLLTTVLIEKSNFLNIKIYEPFSTLLWCCLLSVLVIYVLAQYTCEMLSKTLYTPHLVRKFVILSEQIYYFFGLSYGRGIGAILPTTISARVLSLFYSFFGLLFITSYTADLTAIKATYVEKLPISGFRDEKITIPTSEFKYATWANSLVTEILGNSESEIMRNMNKFMKPYNFKDTTKAIQDVKNGVLHAVLADNIILEYYASQDWGCKLRLTNQSITSIGYGIATTKSSNLNKKLSMFLREYDMNNILQDLKDKWFLKSCFKNDELESMNIISFGGCFALLFTGIGIALLTFSVERIWERR